MNSKLMQRISGKKPEEAGVVKTWDRASMISPEMVGFTFAVHNGRKHINVLVNEDMIGQRLGEFAPTKTFHRHGGRLMKDIEQKARESEISAAKAATTTTPVAK